MSDVPIGEPTPDEIAEACREIQKTWSKSERLRRAGYEAGYRPHWTPQVVRVTEMRP